MMLSAGIFLFSIFVRSTADLFAGSKTILKCDVLSDKRSPPKMVQWFKDGKIIYTANIQANEQRILHVNHKAEPHWVGRAIFNTLTTPASLKLTRLQSADTGEYTCRVIGKNLSDFNTSYYINVKGPMKPPSLMMNYRGRLEQVDSNANEVGPVLEGEPVALICETDKDYPDAEVVWFAVNDDMKYSSLTMPEKGRSTLSIERLGRKHRSLRFSCQAYERLSKVEQQSFSIKLDIYFKPLSITASKNKILYAWQMSELECVVVGSRPAPKVMWYIGDDVVNPTFTHTSWNGNVTTTSVSFKARPEHDGLKVSCHAVNPAFEASAILQESWSLVVHYAPVVDIFQCSIGHKYKEGSSISLDNPPSPDIIYFNNDQPFCLRCSAMANPPPFSIRWFRNSELIEGNTSSSILVIEEARHLTHSGQYNCQVRNVLGETWSPSVKVNVRCSGSTTTSYQSTNIWNVFIVITIAIAGVVVVSLVIGWIKIVRTRPVSIYD